MGGGNCWVPPVACGATVRFPWVPCGVGGSAGVPPDWAMRVDWSWDMARKDCNISRQALYPSDPCAKLLRAQTSAAEPSMWACPWVIASPILAISWLGGLAASTLDCSLLASAVA
eukprot:15758994-Heterocapsa_arctica.AAC.1